MRDGRKKYQRYCSLLMIAILLVRSLSIAVLAKGLIDFHFLASARVRPQPLHQPFLPENWQISIHGLFLRFMINCFIVDQLERFIHYFLGQPIIGFLYENYSWTIG